MMLCPEQEECPDYKVKGREPPNHHVRATVKCVLFVNGECSLLQGQSCKIKALKEG